LDSLKQEINSLLDAQADALKTAEKKSQALIEKHNIKAARIKALLIFIGCALILALLIWGVINS
jgi:hypothetical protein